MVSGCSGHADRNRPSVDAAGSCSYLSDCMSLPAHHHLLRVLGWLPWCLGPTSGAAARSKAKLMQGRADEVTGLPIDGLAASTHANRPLGYCQGGLDTAAEPTAGPNTAASSAATDEIGRVCVSVPRSLCAAAQATTGAPPACPCAYAPFTCTACTTCREELMM